MGHGHHARSSSYTCTLFLKSAEYYHGNLGANIFEDMGGPGLDSYLDDNQEVVNHAKIGLLLYVDWLDVLQQAGKRKLGVICMR